MRLSAISSALTVLVLPLLASAAGGISFVKSDFVSASKIPDHGQVLISAQLSETGKNKVRNLNANGYDQPVHIVIAGLASDPLFRVPISSDHLQIGPFTETEAQTIVSAINQP